MGAKDPSSNVHCNYQRSPLRRSASSSSLARRLEVLGGRPESLAHSCQRAAQAGTGALVEHVRPEPRRQLRARMHPPLQRQQPEQGARPPARGQLQPLPIKLQLELSEHADA